MAPKSRARAAFTAKQARHNHHFYYHPSYGAMSCVDCEHAITFRLKEALVKHLIKRHEISDAITRNAKLAQAQYGEKQKTFACKMRSCEDKFLWEANLLLHLEKEHNIEKSEATKLVSKWSESQDYDDEDDEPDEEQSSQTVKDGGDDGEEDGEDDEEDDDEDYGEDDIEDFAEDDDDDYGKEDNEYYGEDNREEVTEEDGKRDGDAAGDLGGENPVKQDDEESHVVNGWTVLTRPPPAFLEKCGISSK
jgi:hypothetical protein